MKIARLLLVLFALMATTLSAAPKSSKGRPGGSGLQLRGSQAQTDQEAYWFYCYSDPGNVYYCYDDLSTCQWSCEQVCGGPCDWEYNQD